MIPLSVYGLMPIGLWTTKAAHCINCPSLSRPFLLPTAGPQRIVAFCRSGPDIFTSLYSCISVLSLPFPPFTCNLNGPSPKYLYNPHRTACNSLCLTHAPCPTLDTGCGHRTRAQANALRIFWRIFSFSLSFPLTITLARFWSATEACSRSSAMSRVSRSLAREPIVGQVTSSVLGLGENRYTV